MIENNSAAVEDVDDGHTLEGFITGQQGVYDDLHFRYRWVDPVTETRYSVKKSNAARDKTKGDEDKEIDLLMLDVKMLVGQIVEWDLRDARSGEAVGVSEGAVVRYFPTYRYRRLQEIVLLGMASDRRPDEPESEHQGPKESEKNSTAA